MVMFKSSQLVMSLDRLGAQFEYYSRKGVELCHMRATSKSSILKGAILHG